MAHNAGDGLTVVDNEDIEEDLNEDIEEDLIDRAIRAYCTRERRAGRVVEQPSLSGSWTSQSSIHDEAWDGDSRTYAVLVNVNNVLAVYRLREDGHIEHVAPEYWPAWLLEAEGMSEGSDLSRVRADRIRELSARQEALNARDKGQLDRLRNAQRVADTEMTSEWRTVREF